MTYWTNDTLKVKYAQEYFSSFNLMTARIVEKQSQIVNAFPSDEWEQLPVDEQEKIINQRMITPEEVSRCTAPTNGHLPKYYRSVFPKLLVDYGQSYASHNEEDINQAMWRDEHSGPFSWETKSQMNVSLPKPSSKPKSKRKSEEKNKNSMSDFIPELEAFKAPRDLISSHANDISEKPIRSLGNGIKENGDHHSVIDSSKKTSVATDSSFKLDFTLTKPTIHKEPEPEPPRLFNLPEKEVKKRSHSKPKSSSRINPRSSVTLDGAIRNLEIAMQEERQAQEKSVAKEPPPDKPTAFQFDLEKSSDEAAPEIVEDEVIETPTEDPLLLNKHSSNLSLDFEDFGPEPETSVQKSGFDFLDNW